MSGPGVTMADFLLERDSGGRLVYRSTAGQTHVGVVPVRAFPIAAPGEGVSLVSAEGHELEWLPRLAEMPSPIRALIEDELASREFMPELRRLVSVSSYSTPSTWEVETDRGATRFVLKGEEAIRRLPGDRLMITSGQGLHFTVRDVGALDRGSRKLLERFL